MSKKTFFSSRKNAQSGSIQFLTAQVDSAVEPNRPAATKSAGVIGKWGITSFTSLRSSCITGDTGSSKYSVGRRQQPAAPPGTINSEAALAPAPKKFFKSRGQTEENVAPSSVENLRKELSGGNQDVQDGQSRLPLAAVSPPQESRPVGAAARSHALPVGQRPVYTGDIIIGQSSSESDSGDDDSYSPKGKKKRGGKKGLKSKRLVVTPPTRSLRARKVSELEDPPPPLDYEDGGFDDSPPVLSPVKEVAEPVKAEVKEPEPPKPAIKLKIIRNKNDSSLETQLSSPDHMPSKNYSFHDSSPGESPPKLKIRFKGLEPPPEAKLSEPVAELVLEVPKVEEVRPKRSRGRHVSYQELDGDIDLSESIVPETKKSRRRHASHHEEPPDAPHLEHELRRSSRSPHVSYQELDADIELDELPVLKPVKLSRKVSQTADPVGGELPEEPPVLTSVTQRGKRSRKGSENAVPEEPPVIRAEDLPILSSAETEVKRGRAAKVSQSADGDEPPVLLPAEPKRTRGQKVNYQELDPDIEFNEFAEQSGKRNKRGRKMSETDEVVEPRPTRRRTPTPREDPPPPKRNTRARKPMPQLLPIAESAALETVPEDKTEVKPVESLMENVEELKETAADVSEKAESVNGVIDNVEEKLASLFGSELLDESLKSISSEIKDLSEEKIIYGTGSIPQEPVKTELPKDIISEVHDKVTVEKQNEVQCSNVSETPLALETQPILESQELATDVSDSGITPDFSSQLAEPDIPLAGTQVESQDCDITAPSSLSVASSQDLFGSQSVSQDLSLNSSEKIDIVMENSELSSLKLDSSSQNSSASSQEEYAPISQSSLDSSSERTAQPKKAFFKNRSQRPDEYKSKKALAMYKHIWTDEGEREEKREQKTTQQSSSQPFNFSDDFEEPKLMRVASWPKQKTFDDDEQLVTSVKCPKRAKELYTVVKNVKHAHQIQEQGEFQEYQDDVDYILDAMQSGNPVSTRCLSTISLAQKCLAPAFRMHLRAHGTVAKFFHALKDAPSNPSVALCTAAVMFVLSLDRLNVDLDRSSLELMLNLLDSEAEIGQPALDVEYERNLAKVKQICDEVKKKKQATHLTTDNLTAAQLAMETLLSLTSRRAGEWFKEELRELGGIEHLIETVSDCIEYVTAMRDWPRQKLEKLVKLDRCLRVLENVSNLNEENQAYLLQWGGGKFVDSFLELYKTIAFTLGGVGEFCGVLKTWEVDVTLREVLLNVLKFLVNLTHDYKSKSFGSSILGKKPITFHSSLVVLFVVPSRMPEESRFDLMVMVLSVIINLVENAAENRTELMSLQAPLTSEDFLSDPLSACQALVRLFFECEQSALQEERRTDDILDGKIMITREDSQNILDPEEMVKQLLHKAGRHMEDTMVAAYIALILGYLVIDSAEREKVIRDMMPDRNFKNLLAILTKFFKFVNLTSNPGSSMRGLKAMERVIKFMESADMPPPAPSHDDSFATDSSLDISV